MPLLLRLMVGQSSCSTADNTHHKQREHTTAAARTEPASCEVRACNSAAAMVLSVLVGRLVCTTVCTNYATRATPAA
jgi:hypothetical protein